MIGKTLAHYTIVDKLGAGGMGEVYRATDSKLGREVALKVLPQVFAADPERLARFRREARVLAQLNHRNIGAIYGLEEDADVRALVLELVEGPTLADRIQKGRLPVAEALSIALQIAEAVETAHERGIVHRDLKPSNVKLGEDGQLKVLDFGLAKALEGDASSPSSPDSPTLSPTLSPVTGALTGAHVILGTAAYMSPEQARGKSVDKRADIWAFGVILFEMLTGRRLFLGETVSDTLAGVLKTDPPWDALPSDTPPRIVRLLRRCLDRDPRARLRDIGDARIVIGEALGESPEKDAARAGTMSARPRPALGWLAPALLLLGAAGGAAIVWNMKPAPERPVRRFLVPSAIVSDWPWTPRISPDGRRIAYVVSDRLYVRDLDRIGSHVVAGADGARGPFWSPDGSALAFHRDGKLWKVDVAGGQPTTICETGGFRDATWGVDGTIVFDNGRKLSRVSARGGDVGTIRELPAAETRDLHGSDVLPGGRGYVVAVHYDDQTNTLEAWTPSGDHKRILAFTDATLFYPRYAESGFLLYERGRNNKGIWALPFSLSRLEATGDPFLVVPDGIRPSVSREGTLVAVPGGLESDPQLAWVELDSSAVTPIGQTQETIRHPALSPDGAKVVVWGEEDGKSDLWVHDIERSTKTRLTFGENEEEAPIWSEDGQGIYYTYTEGSTSSIYRINADGSGEPESLTAGGYQSISADGRWMAFERDGDSTGLDLWKWSLDGTSEPELFLATNADEENIRLSPDGRWAAYQSDESGHSEVFVKPFPSGPGRWQVTVDGGFGHHWSPEGDRLFFIHGDDLYRVSVETEGGLRLSTPERVLDGNELHLRLYRGYALAPGADRLVAVWRTQPEGEDKPAPGLLVVQNWLSEF